MKMFINYEDPQLKPECAYAEFWALIISYVPRKWSLYVRSQGTPYLEGQTSLYFLNFKIHERILNFHRAAHSWEAEHVQDNGLWIYCKIDSTVKICNKWVCQMRPNLKH